MALKTVEDISRRDIIGGVEAKAGVGGEKIDQKARKKSDPNTGLQRF